MTVGLLSLKGRDSDTWTGVDGRPATLGTPQYPTLLDQYVASGAPRRTREMDGSYNVTDVGRRQPPWMVAGVDYFVGCSTPVGTFPANKTALIGGSAVGNLTVDFKNLINTAAGGSINIDYSFFPIIQICNAINTLVFDGWDLTGVSFSLIAQGSTPQCENVVFNNCQMSAIAAYAGQGLIHGAYGLTLTNCTIDAGSHVLGSLEAIYRHVDFVADATHPVLIRYNWLKGSHGQIFSVSGGPNGGTIAIRNNLFDEGYVDASVVANVTACVAGIGGGGTWIRITLSSGFTIGTIPDGTTIAVAHVGGVPNSQGLWQSKFISNGVFELQNSTFAGSYTGGGSFSYQDPSNTNFNHGNSLQVAGGTIGNGGGPFYWQFNTHKNRNWQSAGGPQIDGGITGNPATDRMTPHFDYNTLVALVTSAAPSPSFSFGQPAWAQIYDEYSNISYTCINGTISNNFTDSSGGQGSPPGNAYNKRSGGWAASGYVDTTNNMDMPSGTFATLG